MARVFPTVLLCLCSVFPKLLPAEEFRITPETKLDPIVKQIKAGDSIVLENGIWKDVDFKFNLLPGTQDEPIRIQAETPGRVILTGKTEFKVSGKHVIVSGLLFRDCGGVGDVFEFRSHDERLAEHCRVTDCVFEESPEYETTKESRWLGVYGKNNRVDHCSFEGKKNKGTTLVVWVTEEPGQNRIDHNYFGQRPELGRNGGETIRIGTSDVSELVSSTTVEDNYFLHCDGEAEIISNKSCENVFRRNVFDECSGTLTLRHGHRCQVDGNVFLGKKKNGTGGVRIIGQGHVVTNNYFEGLRGNSERAALCMMNGIPDSPLHEYSPVREAVVAHNTFIDCKVTIELGVGAGKKQTAAPADCRITNNLFLPGKRPLIRVRARPTGFVWEGNLHQVGRDHKDQLVEFQRRELKLERATDGLMRPSESEPLRSDSESSVKIDIDGEPRGETVLAGCDEHTKSFATWPSATNTGPAWLVKSE